MVPEATVAPLVQSVVHRRLVAICLSFRTVCHDIRDGPCVEGTAASRTLKGALRFGPRSTTTPVRSLQACHFLMRSLTQLTL